MLSAKRKWVAWERRGEIVKLATRDGKVKWQW